MRLAIVIFCHVDNLGISNTNDGVELDVEQHCHQTVVHCSRICAKGESVGRWADLTISTLLEQRRKRGMAEPGVHTWLKKARYTQPKCELKSDSLCLFRTTHAPAKSLVGDLRKVETLLVFFCLLSSNHMSLPILSPSRLLQLCTFRGQHTNSSSPHAWWLESEESQHRGSNHMFSAGHSRISSYWKCRDKRPPRPLGVEHGHSGRRETGPWEGSDIH